MDPGDVGRSVDARHSGEDGSEGKRSPSRGRSVTFVSIEAEVFAELSAGHEEVRRLAEVAWAENKRLVEEKSRLEWRIMSYQQQVADLTAESRRMYLDASNDRMNLERSWQDMNKYKKESEKYRKSARRAEVESVRHTKEMKETVTKMEALVENLSSSEKKCFALEQRVLEADNRAVLVIEKHENLEKFVKGPLRFSKGAYRTGADDARARVAREYPNIDLSFLETEKFCSPLLAIEARVAKTLPADGEGTLDAYLKAALGGDVTKSPPEPAEKVEISQLDIWEREASRLAADRDVALWPPWPIREEAIASSTAEGTHRLEDWPCRGMEKFNRA